MTRVQKVNCTLKPFGIAPQGFLFVWMLDYQTFDDGF